MKELTADVRAFEFNVLTHVHYGVGTVQRLTRILGGTKGDSVLVVTDPGIVKAGLLTPVLGYISEAGLKFAVFDGVEPEPSETIVGEVVTQIREQNWGVLVAVGGGSSMDVAKCAAAMLCSPGKITDYEGMHQLPNPPAIPVIAIPTTAGTGAEVSAYAVITDTARGLKVGVGSWYLAPAYAVVDPLMTLSLPASLTASTGLDALAHAVEAYVVNVTSPIVEGMAIHAVELIASNIGPVVKDGSNLQARANMAYGSLIAGIAMSNSDCGAIHSSAEVLGGFYGIPHGVSIGIMLAPVTEYCVDTVPARYARIAAAMGENTCGLTDSEAARLCVSALSRLAKAVGVPSLRETPFREEDIPRLARLAEAHVCNPSNPKKLSAGDYELIFRRAYQA